jgi:hypothetical protein
MKLPITDLIYCKYLEYENSNFIFPEFISVSFIKGPNVLSTISNSSVSDLYFNVKYANFLDVFKKR